jgi:hypothetical protein
MNNLRSKKRHEVTENEMRALNQRREALLGQELSTDKLKTTLKSLGYATSGNFVKCMTSGENPPIVRVRRGTYVFSLKPIHVERMRKVWHDYCFYGRNRVDSADATQLKLYISRAIALLKQQGYRVLKPITKYEEV